jgi:hypothetical protein
MPDVREDEKIWVVEAHSALDHVRYAQLADPVLIDDGQAEVTGWLVNDCLAQGTSPRGESLPLAQAGGLGTGTLERRTRSSAATRFAGTASNDLEQTVAKMEAHPEFHQNVSDRLRMGV